MDKRRGLALLSKLAILKALSFGEPVAEQEMQRLAEYFVETEQWTKLVAGDKDVVYGPKGSGKSALYSLLLQKRDELFDRGILIKPAETPKGSPAFRTIATDPPETEEEFAVLWKLYFLCLVAEVLREYAVDTPEARRVYDQLRRADLLDLSPLQTLLLAVRRQVRRLSRATSVEAGVAVEASTGTPLVTAKVTLGEPEKLTAVDLSTGLDLLIADADCALRDLAFSVWIVIDRLDVAFAQDTDVEKLALRALFRTYNDMQSCDHIAVKLFLRSDIWRRITAGGFREASHVSKRLTITWQRQSLMNLVVRRLLANDEICEFYRVNASSVETKIAAQEALMLRILPDQVDRGKNPSTFDWMLSRTQDGTEQTAPRELIQLLESLRTKEIERIELGHDEAAAETLFSPSSFKQALREVSDVRLNQTLFAEYPDLQPYIERLEGEKTQQTVRTLASLWGVRDQAEVRRLCNRLVDVGFFEERGDRAEPVYWVPFLYRDALNMVQGEARSFASYGADVVEVLSTAVREMLATAGIQESGRRSVDGGEWWISFVDDRSGARLTLWCFAADAKAALNFRGRPPVIAVGLMLDPNTELDERAYRLRLKDSGFVWYTQINGVQGFRLVVDVPDYSSMAPESIASTVAGKLLRSLQRARFVV